MSFSTGERTFTKKSRVARQRLFNFFDKYAGPIYFLPAVILLVTLMAFPVVTSIYNSFTNYNLITQQHKFIGLKNYINILTNSGFLIALKNSIVWTVGSITLQVSLGLFVALLLNRIKRFEGFFRTMMIIPWAFPSVVIAFVWTWILNDVYGFINVNLMKIGLIDSPILFFADPNKAMLTVMLINVWFGFPLMMVNILGALKGIPQEEYESAAIDGANARQTFFQITLPHIRVVIGLLVALRSIWVFNNFGLIFMITGGGPGTSTETLPLYAYKQGWVLTSLGSASAVTLILMTILIIFFSVYFRLLDRWERIDS